jgi:hypothetical protein
MSDIVRIKLKLNDINKIFNQPISIKKQVDIQIDDDENFEYDENNWIKYGAIFTLYNGKTKKKYSLPTKYTMCPQSTNIKCWHCTLNFNTQPIGLPFKIEKCIINNKWIYYTKGCFCSFSCASTFNSDRESDYIHKENLLYMLYRSMGGTRKTISKAPPYTFLIEYGGILSQKQYKSLLNVQNICTYQVPPMISPIPTFNILLLN